jgi:ribosomal protein S11
MRRKLLALVVSAMALGASAAPAMADDPVSGQLSEQVAGSLQSATSNANSTQINPTNTNISVRVLSPGNDGDVTQSNRSAALSFAGNSNDTTQSADQTQSGGGGGVGIQESGQKAGNAQWANSNAESTQVNPTNRNISVRVLSPGNGGSVDQSNESKAKSFAGNKNELSQDVTQDQSGSMCCAPHPGSSSQDHGDYPKDHGDHQNPCGCNSGVGIQAAGQEAYNLQKAESNAESKQIKPTNSNISVRVLSPGDDGDVSQSNDSTALSGAFNKNDTTQTVDQSQHSGSRCGCSDGVGIQAAAQKAFNFQKADSNAESKQIYPTNKALSVRFKSPGNGGTSSQANSSFAGSLAANRNALYQTLTQTQGS